MKESGIIPIGIIEQRIFIIRGIKVMLDTDLAELYGVPVKRLNEQVKRNYERFPLDFMFQLTGDEYTDLKRSQFATASRKHRNIQFRPYAFTEHGVTMLSSILNSSRAVAVNISVIRAFIRLREILAGNKNLTKKIEEMEKKYDAKIADIFKIIKYLIAEEEKPKDRIGFRK